MKIKKLLAGVMCAALSLSLLTGCGGDNTPSAPTASGSSGTSGDGTEQTFNMKLAHGLAEDHAVHIAMTAWAEEVKTQSNGTINIEIVPNGTLGSETDCLNSITMGALDMAKVSASVLGNFEPEWNVVSVPYVFNDKDHFYKVMDGEIAQDLYGLTEKDGFIGLTWLESGARSFYTANTPIRTPADLNGLKIRTMANEIHLEAWKAMGANPTPMAFGELFTAMQQGTVDGQENPLGIITGNKFEEIEKFCTLTEHVYTPYYVVMNLEKWNSLTAEQQDALTRAMEETTQRQYELSQKYEDEAVGVMEAAGCKVRTLTDEEKLSFKEAADKANSLEAAKKIMYKPELADQMSEELAAYRSK